MKTIEIRPMVEIHIEYGHGSQGKDTLRLNENNLWVITHDQLDVLQAAFYENFLGINQPPILIFQPPPFMTIASSPNDRLYLRKGGWMTAQGSKTEIVLTTADTIHNPLIKKISFQLP